MTLLHNPKQQLYKNEERGQDPKVDLLLDKDPELLSLYEQCEILIRNKMKRRYIESCLITSNDVALISDILEIPEEILAFYQEFFFNVVDWGLLDKLEHIDLLPDTRQEEGIMKTWALSSGLEFIKWRLGKTSSVSPVAGMQSLFDLSVYKSKEAMYNASTSQTSQESLKWANMAINLGKILHPITMDNKGAKKDLEIAIRSVVPDFEGLDSIM